MNKKLGWEGWEPSKQRQTPANGQVGKRYGVFQDVVDVCGLWWCLWTERGGPAGQQNKAGEMWRDLILGLCCSPGTLVFACIITGETLISIFKTRTQTPMYYSKSRQVTWVYLPASGFSSFPVSFHLLIIQSTYIVKHWLNMKWESSGEKQTSSRSIHFRLLNYTLLKPEGSVLCSPLIQLEIVFLARQKLWRLKTVSVDLVVVLILLLLQNQTSFA